MRIFSALPKSLRHFTCISHLQNRPNRPQCNCALVGPKQRKRKDRRALGKAKQKEGRGPSSCPPEGAPPRGRRGPKAKTPSAFLGTLCATHKEGTDGVQQCITSSRRQRTQESCIRKNGKADVEACIRYWNMYRKSVARPSVRAFARMIGEKPSTVRYTLKKGTTADRLTWYLPDQKRWEYFDLSPEFAVEETQRRNANKGPRGKVSNFFVRDFAKRYAKTKSVTYTLKVLHEISPNAYLPSRSTVYRLMDKGELQDARGRPLTHRRYKKNRRKPASTDVPRNHAPKHMVPAAVVASSPLSTPTMAIQQRPAASICTPFQPFLKPP